MPTAQMHAFQPVSCGSTAAMSKRSGSSSSRSFGCVRPPERRPMLSTASTSESSSASRSAPAPTMPLAPSRISFTTARTVAQSAGNGYAHSLAARRAVVRNELEDEVVKRPTDESSPAVNIDPTHELPGHEPTGTEEVLLDFAEDLGRLLGKIG